MNAANSDNSLDPCMHCHAKARDSGFESECQEEFNASCGRLHFVRLVQDHHKSYWWKCIASGISSTITTRTLETCIASLDFFGDGNFGSRAVPRKPYSIGYCHSDASEDPVPKVPSQSSSQAAQTMIKHQNLGFVLIHY